MKKIKLSDEVYYYSVEGYNQIKDWYDYMDWKLSVYGFSSIRKTKEEHSFENWKLNGKPKAGLR